jgi:hypothetical protein
MGDDDGYVRRRTSFEKDLREFILKVIVGVIVGFALAYFSGWDGSIWVPLGIGVAAVLFLSRGIRDHGRHAD